MPDLQQQLTDLALAVAWPPTPELGTRVRNQVSSPLVGKVARGRVRPPTLPHFRWGPRAEGAGVAEAPDGEVGWRAGSGMWYQRPWALAAAALIVAAAAVLAYAPSRTAIADWVDLHVFIRQVQSLPTLSPLPSGPLGKRLGLGNQTTVGRAQAQIPWKIVLPSSLGNPNEVYVQPPPDGPSQSEVTLVYATRPGIPVSGQTGVSVLVTEARGAVDKNFFGKMIGDGTTLEELTVAGHQAYWISGQPHIFFFVDAAGSFRSETMRLATNTLILDYGGTIVRIEGDLTRDQALQIATSLG
jgi:hypothetical protein